MPHTINQYAIPTTYYRGGTSKAIFFHEHVLPPPGPQRDRLLKRAIGSPDPLQLDGMGGSKAVTSKIAIVKPSTRPDADVDYTFAQVGVADDFIGYDANCGNISAAVGPFAIDEGLVKYRPGRSVDPKVNTQEVRIYNTGTRKVLSAHVPITEKGSFESEGTQAIAGVPGTGSPILMDYRFVGHRRRWFLFATSLMGDSLDHRSLAIERPPADRKYNRHAHRRRK